MNTYKTILFVGPSAVGKTYIATYLLNTYPDLFTQSKLYTTRMPREGETAHDRIFVSEKQFTEMQEAGAFLIAERFGGNLYGYTKDALTPESKHILVNTWPAITPQFIAVDSIVMVGMQAPENWYELLSNRLSLRGETKENIAKRISLITDDIQITESHKDLIESHGKFFTIKDDTVVLSEIIPWLLGQI